MLFKLRCCSPEWIYFFVIQTMSQVKGGEKKKEPLSRYLMGWLDPASGHWVRGNWKQSRLWEALFSKIAQWLFFYCWGAAEDPTTFRWVIDDPQLSGVWHTWGPEHLCPSSWTTQGACLPRVPLGFNSPQTFTCRCTRPGYLSVSPLWQRERRFKTIAF